MKILSIVCEEKYNPVAMVVGQYYAQMGDYQNHIRILTPKQYLQENDKYAVFNDGWLFSIGKNECTKLYEHLIHQEVSKEGFFGGVSGHIAIAYHETDYLQELESHKTQELNRLVENVKSGKFRMQDFLVMAKAILPCREIPFVNIVDIKDTADMLNAVDLCYAQKAVDDLLSSDAKEWLK